LKILVLKADAKPSSLWYLAKGLKKRGHEVHVLLPGQHPGCEKLRNLQIPVHINSIITTRQLRKNTFWEDIASFKKLVRLVRDNSFDVINPHLPAARLFGRMSSLFFKKTIIVSVVRELESHHERWTNWIDDATVAVSLETKRYLVSKGIPESKIEVIYNGIDIEEVDGIPEDKYYLHRELGLNGDIKLIGMVGYFYRDNTLADRKGHKVFLDAARIVSRSFPEARFVLVGSNFFPKDNKERFENYAKDLGIQDKVYFLGERPDVFSILSSLYLHVLPSFMEGCPMVLLEAMSRKTPNVASRIGCHEEIIVDKETGVLFEPGNAHHLSECIISLLHEPSRAKALGCAGRRRLETHFAVQEMVRKYEDLFQRFSYKISKS